MLDLEVSVVRYQVDINDGRMRNFKKQAPPHKDIINLIALILPSNIHCVPSLHRLKHPTSPCYDITTVSQKCSAAHTDAREMEVSRARCGQEANYAICSLCGATDACDAIVMALASNTEIICRAAARREKVLVVRGFEVYIRTAYLIGSSHACLSIRASALMPEPDS